VFALAGWAHAPYPHAQPIPAQTAEYLLRAPFASRIVIGDSRVAWGRPAGDALFIGYGGATFRQLERVTRVLCALSDAPVTIALGVNDAKPAELDEAASLASLDAMLAACAPDKVRLAQVWPSEPGVEPAGGDYDLAAISRLNAAIAARAGAGVTVLPVPPLQGHTTDGVHFIDTVSARYMAVLAAPD
jgi:hypothetical protein